MKTFIVFLCFAIFSAVLSHPTKYKVKDNKLELDLVPVSSTVIPLPVYKVGYGIHNVRRKGDEKLIKPDGPIQLITVHSKKKAQPTDRKKPDEISKTKELSKI